MGLKEILAAKKAAAQAEEKINEQEAPQIAEDSVEADVDNGSDSPATNIVADSGAAQEPSVAVSMLQDDELVKPAPPPADKQLSFAEKMALKKQGIQSAQAAPPPKPAPMVVDPALIPDDPVTAADYMDIKQKIHNLTEQEDDNLKNAMQELKAALKKNPAATELMLDEDIGKMVIALRRMTHVAVVEETKGKKAGRKSTPKAKEASLSKEEIEAAFADL